MRKGASTIMQEAALFNRVSENNPTAMYVLFKMKNAGQYDKIVEMDEAGVRGHQVCQAFVDAECDPARMVIE